MLTPSHRALYHPSVVLHTQILSLPARSLSTPSPLHSFMNMLKSTHPINRSPEMSLHCNNSMLTPPCSFPAFDQLFSQAGTSCLAQFLLKPFERKPLIDDISSVHTPVNIFKEIQSVCTVWILCKREIEVLWPLAQPFRTVSTNSLVRARCQAAWLAVPKVFLGDLYKNWFETDRRKDTEVMATLYGAPSFPSAVKWFCSLPRPNVPLVPEKGNQEGIK